MIKLPDLETALRSSIILRKVCSGTCGLGADVDWEAIFFLLFENECQRIYRGSKFFPRYKFSLIEHNNKQHQILKNLRTKKPPSFIEQTKPQQFSLLKYISWKNFQHAT